MRGVSTTAVLAALYVAAVVTRRPDLIADPKFFGEDGQAWFADAHNLPALQALSTPVAGYYQFFQRLVGFAFNPLGLSGAAFAFASVAVAVQVMPALMFASKRFRGVIADDLSRYVLGFVYLLLAADDLTGNLTGTQWHLATLAFLVLIAAPPRSRAGRGFDVAALLVAGLTGPYALFLLPLCAWIHRGRIDQWRRAQLGVLAIGACVQLSLLVANLPTAHRTQLLGASAPDFFLIVANQVLSRFSPWVLAQSALPAAVGVTVAISVLLFAGVVFGPRALRYLVAFATAIAATGLLTPYSRLPDSRPAWDVLATGAGGTRYFFLFAVATVLSVIVVGSQFRLQRVRVLLGAAAVVSVIVVTGLGAWQHRAPLSQHLDRYQALLDRSQPGTTLTIPIYPRGWEMRVTVR